jgi:hypothetical protein
MRKVVQNEGLKEGTRATLDELAREGARRMIEAALEVEVEDYLARFRAERDGDGRALVVRNGRGKERSVTIGGGTVKLRAPRVNDKRVMDDNYFCRSTTTIPAGRSPS